MFEEKDKFRYAEKCLYEYKRNISGLKVLRDDLHVAQTMLDVHAQNYQYVLSFTGEPSSPVHNRLAKIESLEERIRFLERWTSPITQMIEDLTAPEVLKYSDNKPLMDVLRLMYFGKNPPEVIIDELKMTRRTFYRCRAELVRMTMSYLGL